jgi:hypothetical protein
LNWRFHLKNKGITILAESVSKSKDDDSLIVYFASEMQGIVDGAHTYELIVRNKDFIFDANSSRETPITQFVKIEIITGTENGLVTEIAGGLNTAVQVQKMSLAELDKKFEWIKEELEEAGFLDHIAFKQNDSKEYDVRDIIRLLDLFNISEFPNEGTLYPVRAYTSKQSVLKHYLDLDKNTGNAYADNYKKLRPILKDILTLHDTISAQAADKYNTGGGRKAGRLKFIEGPTQPDKKFKFPFINSEGKYRLSGGALLPVLGAFRAVVKEEASNNKIIWHGGFENVLNLWQEAGKQLMEATQETSEELGRNPNAIGKSKKHWAYLHQLLSKQL